MTEKFISPWKGSERTADSIRNQILERFGEAASEEYNPILPHCLTYNAWQALGFTVKKKERSLQSITIVEKKDKKTGQVLKKYPKVVNLFWKGQVKKIE